MLLFFYVSMQVIFSKNQNMSERAAVLDADDVTQTHPKLIVQ